MQQEVFEVKRERFHLLDDSLYILQGNLPKDCEIKAFLDKTPLKAEAEVWENRSALERFADLDLMRGQKMTVTVHLPENLHEYKRLLITAVTEDGSIPWFSVSVKSLEARRAKPYYFIEEERVSRSEGTVRVRGWVVFREPVSLKLYDENGTQIPCTVQWNNRADVAQMYQEAQIEEKCGFYVELNQVSTKIVYLVFRSKDAKAVYPVHTQKFMIMKKKIEKYAVKGTRYLKAHGAKALAAKTVGKLNSVRKGPVPYQKWLPKHLPTAAQLEKQRQAKFDYRPCFSIVVPLYKTPQQYLDRLIASIKEQTYANWELCLSDGSGADSPIRGALEKYRDSDPRIRVLFQEKPLQISENTNAAIEIATGEYIVFADHDDELTPNALYECVKALNSDPEIEILYSDEDKMSMDGHKFFQPHFKPDFNIDLLRTVNYICHLFVVKHSVIERVGMLRSEFDGAQDYDFIFRCTEAAGAEKIHHIPMILYHWRSHEDSTAENPESKLYAFDAGQRAIEAHYERVGIHALVQKGEYLGLYRTKYIRPYDPLVSIIIPNKDHIDDLKRCIDSIEEKSAYRNYEYIIVENNSTEPETFEFYKKLEAENEKVRVVYWKDIFNYSAINNFGVQHAKGEYLWLLNNDTEIINPDCLEELLGYCMRDDVGIVGARLYFEDDTIQHAGVVIGFGGIAGHCFVQQPRGYTGYCHRVICAQDYSAVTAACMMVKRSVYEAVDGFSTELQVAFNDIDFCMKVRSIGKLVVYNPYAELYHYESKSRGLEDTPEKVARFNREIATFEKRWPDILRDGDPYYNPNLTLDSQDFSLKRI